MTLYPSRFFYIYLRVQLLQLICRTSKASSVSALNSMQFKLEFVFTLRLQAVLKRSRWGFLRTTASSLISALQGGSNAQPVQQKPWWNPVKPKPSNAPPPVKLGDNLKKKVLAMAAISSTLLLERIKFGEEVLAAHAPALLIAFMFK